MSISSSLQQSESERTNLTLTLTIIQYLNQSYRYAQNRSIVSCPKELPFAFKMSTSEDDHPGSKKIPLLSYLAESIRQILRIMWNTCISCHKGAIKNKYNELVLNWLYNIK